MIHCGDALEVLRTLPDGCVQTTVTSPPYWGLRDYGSSGQMGLEPTPDAYVARMVEVFREVRRALRKDGTLWLNMGDSYANGDKRGAWNRTDAKAEVRSNFPGAPNRMPQDGLKPKDLVGIPWRFTFALQEDGWWLRSDIIWAKPNPMPESVTDRPTKSHEYIFLLSKSERYYYDAEAVKDQALNEWRASDMLSKNPGKNDMMANANENLYRTRGRGSFHSNDVQTLRNLRTVWTIATQPYLGAHFATFPEEIPSRCIRAGSKPGDTVLDPFAGSGTTLAVAKSLGRKYIGIEVNPEYMKMAEMRLSDTQRPLFAEAL